MGRKFKVNNELKKKYLKEWLCQKTEYLKRKRMSVFLKVLGGAIVLIFTAIFGIGTNFATDDMFIGFGCGICFGCTPFIIGVAMNKNAVYEYGAPFSKREGEYLLIADNELEFGSSNVDNKYKNSMDIYSIQAKSISAINLNGNVLTIIGEGKLTSYVDIVEKRINWRNSERRFYSDTPFSILLAYDEKEEIIDNVKKMHHIQVN